MSAGRAFRLIAEKDVGTLKSMMKGCFDIKELDDEQQTLFHAAVCVDSRTILSMLIEYNKRQREDQQCDINARDGSGHTPLDRSVIRKFDKCTRLLIQKGASVWHCQRVTGNTPLHIAATLGSAKITKILLSAEGARANINVRNEFGYTAIQSAVCNGRYDCYVLLRNAGADLTILTNNGDTLTHAAARIDDMQLINELLELLPESDLILNNFGETPAVCAKAAGQKRIQRMLVVRRPEVISIISRRGVSPVLDYTSILEEREESSVSRSASSSSCE